ncbi:MAG: DUF2442 domain-containing protein [Caldilineales bacterium]|nr:DUF2442 domain-containing protein [Caldilineales bacterium]
MPELERRRLVIETELALASAVKVTDDDVILELSDGRTVSAPLAWYPRLLIGTPQERENWRLIGGEEGIHWPDLDEDISVENVLFGRPSGESQPSFKRWLEDRTMVAEYDLTTAKRGKFYRPDAEFTFLSDRDSSPD